MSIRRIRNRRAGANISGRDVSGKHHGKQRFKSGDNWTVCMRCGKDLYASQAVADGYDDGLIVCPDCYDPPHPQDYIKPFVDDMKPLEGVSTGDLDSGQYDAGTDNSNINTVSTETLEVTSTSEVSPSTEVPATTFTNWDDFP